MEFLCDKFMKTRTSTLKACILVAALAAAGMLFPIHTGRTPAAETQKGKRDLRLQPPRPLGEWPGSAKRFALLIGVDQYADTQITPLSGASNDVKALEEALVRYAGFPRDQVTLLASGEPLERQPTRVNILRRLSNLAAVVPKDGLLVVAFSGHGMERGGQAFLLPSDAQVSNDVDLLEQTALNVTQMKDKIRRTGVGQVVLFLDACRNDPTAGRADAANLLTQSYTRGFSFDVRNREVTAFATLYATAVGHRAYEYKEKKQGYFMWALVEGLKGKAANEKGEVTLSRVIQYLQDWVPKRVLLDLGPGKEQRPFAVVEGYKADELVVAVSGQPGAAGPGDMGATGLSPGVDLAAVELSFWETIKNSKNPEDFKAYLRKYPNGTFAELAKIRLRVLSRPQTPRDPPMPLPGLNTYQFEVMTVDAKTGRVTERRKGKSQYFIEDLGGRVTLEMVEIPGGTFQMGSSEAEADRLVREYEQQYDRGASRVAMMSQYETPQHPVTVPSFYMGKFEVTQAQWRAVASLPKVKQDLNPDPSRFKGDHLPVENVSWRDAMELCLRLQQKTGRPYRLPSEAEWEYASRAGTTTPFHFGEALSPALVNYASKEMRRHQTTPIGSLEGANAFGLYDMHGNVAEWCLDSWHESYQGAPSDGSIWRTGGHPSLRVLRGGAWNNGSIASRSAARHKANFDRVDGSIGFRVVMGRMWRF